MGPAIPVMRPLSFYRSSYMTNNKNGSSNNNRNNYHNNNNNSNNHIINRSPLMPSRRFVTPPLPTASQKQKTARSQQHDTIRKNRFVAATGINKHYPYTAAAATATAATTTMKRPTSNKRIITTTSLPMNDMCDDRHDGTSTMKPKTSNDKSGTSSNGSMARFVNYEDDTNIEDRGFVPPELSQLTMSQGSTVDNNDSLSMKSSNSESRMYRSSYPPLHQCSSVSSESGTTSTRRREQVKYNNTANGFVTNHNYEKKRRSISFDHANMSVHNNDTIMTPSKRSGGVGGGGGGPPLKSRLEQPSPVHGVMTKPSCIMHSTRSPGVLHPSLRGRTNTTPPPRGTNEPFLVRMTPQRIQQAAVRPLLRRIGSPLPSSSCSSSGGGSHGDREKSHRSRSQKARQEQLHRNPTSDTNNSTEETVDVDHEAAIKHRFEEMKKEMRTEMCKGIDEKIMQEQKSAFDELKTEVKKDKVNMKSVVESYEKRLEEQTTKLNEQLKVFENTIAAKEGMLKEEFQKTVEKFGSESESYLQKIDSAAKCHLDAMSRSASSSIKMISNVVEAAKEALKKKCEGLVGMLIPKLLSSSVRSKVVATASCPTPDAVEKESQTLDKTLPEKSDDSEVLDKVNDKQTIPTDRGNCDDQKPMTDETDINVDEEPPKPKPSKDGRTRSLSPSVPEPVQKDYDDVVEHVPVTADEVVGCKSTTEDGGRRKSQRLRDLKRKRETQAIAIATKMARRKLTERETTPCSTKKKYRSTRRETIVTPAKLPDPSKKVMTIVTPPVTSEPPQTRPQDVQQNPRKRLKKIKVRAKPTPKLKPSQTSKKHAADVLVGNKNNETEKGDDVKEGKTSVLDDEVPLEVVTTENIECPSPLGGDAPEEDPSVTMKDQGRVLTYTEERKRWRKSRLTLESKSKTNTATRAKVGTKTARKKPRRTYGKRPSKTRQVFSDQDDPFLFF